MYIRIPEELHARVKESAGKRGISMNQLTIEALGAWLDSVHLLATAGTQNSIVTLSIPKAEMEKVEQFLEELAMGDVDEWSEL